MSHSSNGPTGSNLELGKSALQQLTCSSIMNEGYDPPLFLGYEKLHAIVTCYDFFFRNMHRYGSPFVGTDASYVADGTVC